MKVRGVRVLGGGSEEVALAEGSERVRGPVEPRAPGRGVGRIGEVLGEGWRG